MTGTDEARVKWPTLADRVKTWEGTCNRCGEKFPPETKIIGVWSPTRFWISCDCCPRICVEMVATP